MKHPQAHDSESEPPESGGAPSDPSDLHLTPAPLNQASRANPSKRQAAADGEALLLRAHHSIAASLLSASGIAIRARAARFAICDYPLKPHAQRTWARRSAKLVASIKGDLESGLHAPQRVASGLDLLGQLLATAPSNWPAAERLVGCANRLLPSEATRTLQGFAHLIEGDFGPALRVFEASLARTPARTDTALVEEGLGYGRLLCGEFELAQAAMERAAEQTSARVSALAWSLHLALRVGTPREIEHSAARLDLLVASSSTEFSACLGRMRKMRVASMESNPAPNNSFGRARMASIRLTQWARENRSSSGRVARAMG